MSNQVLSLAELNKLLAEWQAKRATASRNVIELLDQPTFKYLTGTGGFKPTQLTGVTDTRCTAKLNALNELWGQFVEVGRVLDEAQAKRDALPRRPGSDQLKEIQDLLTGPSIKFTVQLPFAQRSLLTPAEVATGMTLERVMASMVTAYDEGKVVVLEVDAAVNSLLADASSSQRDIDELKALAVKLGEGDLPELEALRSRAKALEDTIYSDPLGTRDSFKTAIKPHLEAARNRIHGLRDVYDNIVRDLARARDTLKSLTDTRKRAAEAYAEREEKVLVENADKLPRPPEASAVAALEEWLGRLEAGLASNKWKPVEMGVANWSIQAARLSLSCQEAYSANLEPLNKRRELRAFLDALKAKAQGFGRAEDQDLADIENAARALLYTRPTRLAEANKLVQSYAANLR